MDSGRSERESAATGHRPIGDAKVAEDKKAAERERLANALRSNLKRRKAQGRARRTEGADLGRPSSDPE